MKYFAFAMTMLITLSANKCSDGKADMGSLKDVKWVVQSLAGETVQLPAGIEQPWLKLEGDQLQGFGGCNRLIGSYTLTGSELNFLGIGSTKMYCEGIQGTETAIIQMLNKVETFKMDKSGVRLYGGGQELAKLKAE